MKPQIIRHGEVILKPDTLPKKAKLEQLNKKVVVAHSETGHNHVLEALSDIKVYSWNGETYLEVPELSKLWHQKSGRDTHTPHKVAPSVYKVIIKKQFDYFKGVLERVRD